MDRVIVGLGWDVGGWMGKKQGIAAVQWNRGEVRWLYTPKTTKLPKSGVFLPTDFYESIDMDNKDQSIVVGIDAPLGYPAIFSRLVSGEYPSFDMPQSEINNRYAYRDTERFIYSQFNKKPLSATFDKLGNNTSLAVTTVRMWCLQYGFSLNPFGSDTETQRKIIEVYPALLKSSSLSQTYSRLQKLVPIEYNLSSDSYDAAMCALLALAYGLGGLDQEFPRIMEPPHNWNGVPSEGWIYYPVPDFLKMS